MVGSARDAAGTAGGSRPTQGMAKSVEHEPRRPKDWWAAVLIAAIPLAATSVVARTNRSSTS